MSFQGLSCRYCTSTLTRIAFTYKSKWARIRLRRINRTEVAPIASGRVALCLFEFHSTIKVRLSSEPDFRSDGCGNYVGSMIDSKRLVQSQHDGCWKPMEIADGRINGQIPMPHVQTIPLPQLVRKNSGLPGGGRAVVPHKQEAAATKRISQRRGFYHGFPES